MNTSSRALVFAIALSLTGTRVIYADAQAVSFSALYLATNKGVSRSPFDMMQKGTIWVSGTKIRTEYLDQGHVMAHIVDTAQHTAYLVVPDQNFVEDDSKGGMPALPTSAPSIWIYDVAMPCKGLTGATCTDRGADVVDGRTCESWQMQQPGKSWLDCIESQYGIVLREIQGDRTFELSELKVHPLKASLFEVPAGVIKGGFTRAVFAAAAPREPLGSIAEGSAAPAGNGSASSSAAAGAAGAKLTTASPVGDLLDNPMSKAILVRLIPEVVNNPQLQMARGLPLQALQQFEPILTAEKLSQIDAELAAAQK